MIISQGRVEYLLLQIPLELLNRSIDRYKSIRFGEYFPRSELIGNPIFENMINYLLAMRMLYEHGEDGYQFLFASNLNLFLHAVYRHYTIREDIIEKNKASKHLSRLKEVIDYVELNYMEPLSLKKAASLAALNP